jgi:hypothetical protein
VYVPAAAAAAAAITQRTLSLGVCAGVIIIADTTASERAAEARYLTLLFKSNRMHGSKCGAGLRARVRTLGGGETKRDDFQGLTLTPLSTSQMSVYMQMRLEFAL